MPTSDIHIVMAAVPAYGHVRPMRSLASSLTERGYPVTFITGRSFRRSLEAIKGVEFIELHGKADIDVARLNELFPERSKLPKNGMGFLWDLEHVFFAALPDQHEALQHVLKRTDLAHKKVVVLADATFGGTIPMLLDSPDTRRVPVVGLGNFPLAVTSKDTAPFGMGLPSQGPEKNMELNAQVTQMMGGVQAFVKRVLEPYQCTKPVPGTQPLDLWCNVQDIYCQLCVPALEPPRSDLPKHIRFLGTLLGANDKKPPPEWFDSFVVNGETNTPLVMVTSGTLPDMDPHELIIPTVDACRDLPVRLVICAVHASRPADLVLPDNARWAEWISFEDLFKYTDIVVSNGGYGGINQAFASGIPMIVAGMTEDKAETTARAEMTGAAINLKCQTPTSEQVREALEKVLKDGMYKQKALDLKTAYAECDAVGSFVQAIDEMAKKFYGVADGQVNGHA